VLIDTGGNLNYSYADNLITFFKSIGITKIKYMVLTHGDYDHLGEAINIINKFNVENIILNCNEINDLELNLITNSKSNIYKCVKEIP
jgi:competence protein ComEC